MEGNDLILPDYSFFADNENIFKLIEEQQDIDIQAIEELDEEIAYTNLDLATSWSEGEMKIVKQQNQILKAIKQLDRREER